MCLGAGQVLHICVLTQTGGCQVYLSEYMWGLLYVCIGGCVPLCI